MTTWPERHECNVLNYDDVMAMAQQMLNCNIPVLFQINRTNHYNGYVLTLIGSWKKTYVNGKGGGNDPKTKIAVTFFLLKIYWWNFRRL